MTPLSAINKLYKLQQRTMGERQLVKDIDEFCKKTGWHNRIHLEYWMTIRNIINPNADKTIGFYPCSGADALAFLLTTDAEVGCLVDGIAFGAEQQIAGIQLSVSPESYWSHKSLGGNLGGGFSWMSLLEATHYLRIPLIWELEAIGAEKVVINQIEKDVHQVDFDWAYWGENKAKSRKILFFSGIDTRFPEQYPASLKQFLANGIDFYMEKAAKNQQAQYNAPLDWGKRWEKFNAFTRFNRESVIITTQIPEAGIEGYKPLRDDILTVFERNGAKFGVWTVVLLAKQCPT